MSAAWRELDEELARWRDAGREVEFWLRDDDATRPEPRLDRLLALCAAAQVPIALAVVPQGAEAALFAALGEGVEVLQHGTDHRNRAPAGEKKTEYPRQEPVAEALSRLRAGGRILRRLCGGARLLPVLAPPWNRISGELRERLGEAGLRGLSGYGSRASREPAPGIVQVNTHVDLVAWRRGRGFVGEEEALSLALRHLAARRSGAADRDEPTGWLAHHAEHDEAAFGFLARLLEATRRAPGVRWRRASELFGAA